MPIELDDALVRAAGRKVLLVELHAEAKAGIMSAAGALHNLANMIQKDQQVEWDRQLQAIKEDLTLHFSRRDEIAKEFSKGNKP